MEKRAAENTATEKSGRKFSRKSRKIAPVPNAENLQNAAFAYLARYAASAASLRRVLLNRLRRAMMFYPDFAADIALQAQLKQLIETIIEKHLRSGILNDATFADMKINSLRRQGRSRRFIEQKLAHKGIAATIVAQSFIAREEDDGQTPEDSDRVAAKDYARKKRLGRYRQKIITDPDLMQKQKQKDIASLARAGFSLTIARQALGYTPGMDDDDLD